MSITHGMDLKKALKAAKKLGCQLLWTGGDVKLRHPNRGTTHRISGHRRCAPRYLTQWLMAL
jgi:hypothetical protein